MLTPNLNQNVFACYPFCLSCYPATLFHCETGQSDYPDQRKATNALIPYEEFDLWSDDMLTIYDIYQMLYSNDEAAVCEAL